MQSKIFKEDQGINFGRWTDIISNLMYIDSTREILLSLHTIPDIIADYGGANGNLKQFLPQSISIDIDESKNPDILDNILTHIGEYELIIIRYVLHYLNDYEVIQLFDHLKSYHKGEVLLIQFCNNDLKSKYHNSLNEFKYFRTEEQLKALIPDNSEQIFEIEYICGKEFYKNRLNIDNAIEHKELINAYLINYG